MCRRYINQYHQFKIFGSSTSSFSSSWTKHIVCENRLPIPMIFIISYQIFDLPICNLLMSLSKEHAYSNAEICCIWSTRLSFQRRFPRSPNLWFPLRTTWRRRRRKDSRSRSISVLKALGSEGKFLEDNVEDSRSIFWSNIVVIFCRQRDTLTSSGENTTSS